MSPKLALAVVAAAAALALVSIPAALGGAPADPPHCEESFCPLP